MKLTKIMKTKTSTALCGLITGLLMLAAQPASAQGTLYGVAIDLSGSGTNELVTIDTTTGAASSIVALGVELVGFIAFAPSGTLYGVDNNLDQLVTIDTTTGAATPVGGPLGVGIVAGIAFAPNGTLYGVDNNLDQLVTIDTTTGAATPVGLGVERPVAGIAFAPSGTLYGLELVNGAYELVTIDTTTGAAATVGGPFGVEGLVFGIAFAPSGTLYGVANDFSGSGTNRELVTIDTTTGAATPVGGPFGLLFIIAGLSHSAFTFDVNDAPTADAGIDQSIRAGATVNLDGSASFDDNTDSALLEYSWSFFSKPAGSIAILLDDTTATPSFVADVAGSYVVDLVVTDEQGADSAPSSIIISSDNQAPTAVATVDFGLAIIGTTSNFDGTGSTDPELDSLTYSWSITTAPVGSTATLGGANTDSPTLSTDVEGTYELTLTVSDFLGAGITASVEVVATTPGNYAEIQIVYTSDVVEALASSQITNGGNQNALSNSLQKVMKDIQDGKTSQAIDTLTKALERTDGCALRGRPDGNGKGKDWITDCAAQEDAYALLTSAIDALQQPPAPLPHPALLIEVIDTEDPLLVGEETTYVIQITNQGTAADTNVGLWVQLPSELSIVSAAGDTQGTISGNNVNFAPYASLAAKEIIQFRVVAKAVSVGDARFRAQMSSDLLETPVPEEEATQVY